jgi:type III secretory pathway component EscU
VEKLWIPLITSLISGLIAIYVARIKIEKEVKLAEDRLRQEYKTEYSVKEAIRQLMRRGFKL